MFRFEKYKKNGETMHAFAGYATVYEYFAYPKNIRPRISQMLVLPPFQRQGLGAALLTSIYNHYKIMSEVKDITGTNIFYAVGKPEKTIM